jgi:hypothetical protein
VPLVTGSLLYSVRSKYQHTDGSNTDLSTIIICKTPIGVVLSIHVISDL